MTTTFKTVPRRTSPQTGDAIWMKFECGAGSRWTSTTEDSTGTVCNFSGCNCGTLVKKIGETDDRYEKWFGLHAGRAGVLVFEGAGWDKTASSSNVGNCRVRTRIKNNDGVSLYLELMAVERSKYDKPPRPFEITGYVSHCFSDDCNEVSQWRLLESNARIDYTADGLLKWVNQNLNCSFDTLRVINDGSVLVHETHLPLCESVDTRGLAVCA